MKIEEDFIDTEKILSIFEKKTFKMLYIMGTKSVCNNDPSLYHFGLNNKLTEIEASVLSTMFHSILVDSACCYLKVHPANEMWKAIWHPNEIFNHSGIRLYKLSKKNVGMSLLQMETKPPKRTSSKVYRDFYNMLESTINAPINRIPH